MLPNLLDRWRGALKPHAQALRVVATAAPLKAKPDPKLSPKAMAAIASGLAAAKRLDDLIAVQPEAAPAVEPFTATESALVRGWLPDTSPSRAATPPPDPEVALAAELTAAIEAALLEPPVPVRWAPGHEPDDPWDKPTFAVVEPVPDTEPAPPPDQSAPPRAPVKNALRKKRSKK